MQVSIDVVIPSFRLHEANILPILEMPVPDYLQVSFYLVIDHPQAQIPESIARLADQRRVFILVNDENRGASFTRNRGIDAGSAEWILFLDDDLLVPENVLTTYANAASEHPDETGFIGRVQLPPADTKFAEAICVSGAMDIFNIAAVKSSYAWGATANIMVRRTALKGVRFSLAYPRSGGGEDIDFFLRVREKNGERNFRSLPAAVVHHPWWNQGRPDYRKSYRYGLGNSWLPQLNPAYAYHDFLNTPETIAVGLPLLVVGALWNHQWVSALYLLGGILVIEFLATLIQTKKRAPEAGLLVIFYVQMMRFVYECGLLRGNLARGRISGIGERFHDDGKKNKLFFYRTNTHRIVKWILYPVLLYLFFRNYF